ncbi:MAG: thiamine-binding protein [Spirochaetaceae bacterium]|jgi:uncharacterized protein YqgV (UPF0045/DUF77 family)|nr:thiamine-binding protein [Spirochaetaceae bacterium]
MCQIPKKITVSCQLSFVTLGDAAYNKDIDKVITIIEKSGLVYTVGKMSTIVKGDAPKVMDLINTLCAAMADKKFVITMSISNLCNCKD